MGSDRRRVQRILSCLFVSLAGVLATLLPAVIPCARAAEGGATPAEQISVAKGFRIELLKSARPEEGSWVCLATDGKGWCYLSPQGRPPGAGVKKTDAWGGLWRFAVEADGRLGSWDKVPVPVGDAMGLLWAFDSLYVSGDGPEGRGIYRLQDGDGDGGLDSWALFKTFSGGGGEHGAHALVLGPDRKIYVIQGNSAAPPGGVAEDSPFRHYAEDDLLPRVLDPVATFFARIRSPYGYVLRTDENGTRWEMVAGGLRNAYDADFNADGELITWDSDMEWDVGTPWYRATRVLHLVPGGEYGFREGTAKWPAGYADSLPAAVDIGLGSPTGVKFGTRSHFPGPYRRACFAMDWTFGRILAIHLRPQGASYTAVNPLPSPYHLKGASSSPDVEEFVRGKGLPMTDLEFAADGSMLFITGGRGTQSGLYRVSWTGAREGVQAPLADPGKELRAARAALESGQADPWAWLGKERFVTYAARLALERQGAGGWRERALAEKDPRVAFPALLALARVGEKSDQDSILHALGKFSFGDLPEDLQLDLLRVLELTLARQGPPGTDWVQTAIARLSPHYPARSFAVNRELAQLLVHLGAPGVVERTMALLEGSGEPAEQLWYALCLREAGGWTQAQREDYFRWFGKAKAFRGGNSLQKVILKIRDLALEKAPQEQRASLLALAEKGVALPVAPAPATARGFVKAWTVADLAPVLDGVSKGRDVERGKRLFKEAICSQCHLFAGEGGTVGPDLTAVSGRFSRKDIVEAIVEPSKALSDQYASYLVTLKDGPMVWGQIGEETATHLSIIVNPFTGERQSYPKEKIVKRELSPVSLMPPGLLFSLSQDEVLDLLAYLESAGETKAP